MSSEAYQWVSGIMWDDMNMEKMNYSSQKAYGISKLANILHAKELARRLKDSGIVAFSLHPGYKGISEVTIFVSDFPHTSGFVETEIFKKSGSGLFNGCCGRMMISNVASTPLQGAQTTLGWNL